MATDRKPGTRRDTLGPSTRAVHAGRAAPPLGASWPTPPRALDATGAMSSSWDADDLRSRLRARRPALPRAVLERLPLRGDETVLDAGCGTGGVTARAGRAAPAVGRVIAVDGSEEMVDARRGPRSASAPTRG